MKLTVTLSAQEVENIVRAYLQKKFPNRVINTFVMDHGSTPVTAELTELIRPKHDMKE